MEPSFKPDQYSPISRANKTSKSKMNPLVIFAILTIFAVAEGQVPHCQNRRDPALPASEKYRRGRQKKAKSITWTSRWLFPLEDPTKRCGSEGVDQ
ncbi:hypothetical protein MTP99_014065 [Tenebrio molitor]|nr:hypothetical protein MTP99_014065 [Tenebrio molitor]